MAVMEAISTGAQSAAGEVYRNNAIMKMITDHMNIAELAGMMVLEKAFLSRGMDLIGMRHAFLADTISRTVPDDYYKALRASVRRVMVPQALWFQSENDASNDDLANTVFRPADLSNLVRKCPELRIVSGAPTDDIYHEYHLSYGTRTPPSWTLDRHSRTLVIQSVRCVPPPRLTDGDLGCRLDVFHDWPDWPDYDIKHELLIEYFPFHPDVSVAYDEQAVDTALADPRVHDFSILGWGAAGAMVLLLHGLRHRRQVLRCDDVKLNRVRFEVYTTQRLDLPELFTESSSFLGLQLIVQTESDFADLVDNIEWPPQSFVRIRADSQAFLWNSHHVTRHNVIEITLPEETNLDLTQYIRVIRRLRGQLDSLDIREVGDSDRRLSLSQLAAFVTNLVQSSPGLDQLSISFVFLEEDLASMTHAAAIRSERPLKRFVFDYFCGEEVTGAERLRVLFFIAGNLVQLCGHSTNISTGKSNDFGQGGGPAFGAEREVQEDLCDLLQWLSGLRCKQRDAVMHAELGDLIPSTEHVDRPWRDLEFDSNDQPLPLD